MGKTIKSKKVPFTSKHVKDRDLVIRMLRSENDYVKTSAGQKMLTTKLNFSFTSLMTTYAFHRIVLNMYGFDTTNESVRNYRNIFRTYFRSPHDYDKDVIESVYYMRENKCVFYTKPVINIGDTLTDCELLTRDGNNTTLFELLSTKKFNNAIISAFSHS